MTSRQLYLLSVLLGALGPAAYSQSPLGPAGNGGQLQRDWMRATPNGAVRLVEHGWGPVVVRQNQAVGGSRLIWQEPSDGSWIAGTARLANHGTQFTSEHGNWDNELVTFSGHEAPEDPVVAPTPVWARNETGYNFERSLDSASEGTTGVSLHQVFSGMTGSTRHTVLRKFSTTTGELLWTYESPVEIPGHAYSGVCMSTDGETVVQLVWNSYTGKVRVSSFDSSYDANSLEPTVDTEIQTLGPFEGFELSADGSTLVMGSNLVLTFLDVASGAVIHQEYLFGLPQFGAMSFSGDASLAAFGTYGKVVVYQRVPGAGYEDLFEVPLGTNQYAATVALSADGSTLVAGVQTLTELEDARLIALDVASQQPLWDTTFSGGGEYQNIVAELSITPDGERFAAGLWGDEDNLVPEVLVFRRESPNPLIEHHLEGSVMDLDLAPNGIDLAVASKGVHANVLGGGGALSYFKVGPTELCVVGIPHVGQDVTIEVAVRSGGSSRVLVATGLATIPAPAPQYGSGLLFLDPSQIVTELVAGPADEGHVARVTYPVTLNQTVYIQTVNEDHGRLSKAWVLLTPVP